MAEYVIEENGEKIVLSKEEYELYKAATVTVGVPTVFVSGEPENINKPDGTTIDPIIKPPSNISKGSATPVSTFDPDGGVTEGIESAATFNPNKSKSNSQDPTKTGNPFSEPASSSPDSPPFDNILEKFSTFNALWTMACLEPNQYNNPSSYRENFQSVKNVVFSSAGRYDEARTPTVNGSPEYFVNDFNLVAKPVPLGDGNSNITGYTFTVYEPYSMGLFLQSLLVSAKSAGYNNYLEMCPYLLKLDFIGNTDDGNLGTEVTAFSRFFTIKITNITQKVNEAGSTYTVSAVPFHHIGFGDATNTIKTDVLRLSGGSVEEVLSSGPESLVKYLNEIESEAVKSGQRSLPDVYEIVFPENSSDTLGIDTGSTGFSLGATLNPKELASAVISKATASVSSNIGGNPIGSSTMNFDAGFGGNFVHAKEDQTIDEETGLTDRSKVTTDPTKREFRFGKGERITQVIQKVILVSQYAANALDVTKFDKYGMTDWFRVDLQIQLLEYDTKRATRARKYTYRILPYKVDGSLAKNPSAPTAGSEQRKEIICKRYDYIYSGQNNNILDLNLEFNTMFYTAALPRPPEKTGINNLDTQNITDTPKDSAPINEGGTSVITSASGTPEVKPDRNTVKDSVIGQKSVLAQIADVFQERFKNSSADMVNVTMEILGDPYFLSDSGLNSNYFAPPGINNQITGDNALNYESGDIFVYITFRTPIEPNLSTSGDGGLYQFANNGGISPYSGIFRIINIENKFNDGKFTQTLSLLRVLGQSNDFEGQESIVKQNISLYGEIISLAPESTPAADPKGGSTGESESPGGIDQLLDTGLSLVNTASSIVNTGVNIVSAVKSGNILGAASTLLSGLDAASVNQRPSSPQSSAAPETTGAAVPGESTTRYDITGVQRAARDQAIQSVLNRGGTIQEAEAAGQRAGNLAGANALRNIR